MSVQYRYDKQINLHVKGRISENDAARQMRTAGEILSRFTSQPGVILADEVGMGKTYVALAAAMAIALADKKKRPIVIMVPPSLKDKWPREFEVFREYCIPEEIAGRLSYGVADRAVQFLKYLDDPEDRKKSVIFLTHGALSRSLNDKWVKLAIIQRSLKGRHHVGDIKTALARFLPDLLVMRWIGNRKNAVWPKLLGAPPSSWLSILRKFKIDPENDNDPQTDDDPVPELVTRALDGMDLSRVYEVLKTNLPRRQTKYYKRNLRQARSAIDYEIKKLWSRCISCLDYTLPLLVLDEAHHLKNPNTKIASLFQVKEAGADVQEIVSGPLNSVFERMLFLTATPFQLGHHELCSVLERFEGITWKGAAAPAGRRDQFMQAVKSLRRKLDTAQESALLLESFWGKLKPEDVESVDGLEAILSNPSDEAVSGQIAEARKKISQTQKAMQNGEIALKPWVIRHNRDTTILVNNHEVQRRQYLPGNTIVNEKNSSKTANSGILIEGDSLLPFLLAARITARSPNKRPVFAEGLSSSYEAFMLTRRNRKRVSLTSSLQEGDVTDADDESVNYHHLAVDSDIEWYLDRLQEIIPLEEESISNDHPKMTSTVNRVVDLWNEGEKVLVFCHYIATGRALRNHISSEVKNEILKMGEARLGTTGDGVFDTLNRMGERFFDEDSPVRRETDARISEAMKRYPDLTLHRDELTEIIRRYMRTPAFLVRYFDLANERLEVSAVRQAFEKTDASRLTLAQMIENFFDFLVCRCGSNDRTRYIEALKSIQTGAIMGAEAAISYSDEEIASAQGRTEALLPNVRLVNGATRQETRQRLMLTFNTPFFPEILIASSVMAEGVDLHLNCRHIIHHDLCWNPSTLEQRTGRIDRIGAKVEQCGKSIKIYLPYIAETQDEKMYRVVTDRERWFKVVMGERIDMDARSTEKIAERIPFPASLAEELAFDLGL